MAKFINTSDLIILTLVALLLLVLDRIYRINYIKSFKNPKQCGIGMPPCKFGEKCANGYCIDMNVPKLKPTMLPVFP